jgi:hypothetical protein
MFDVGGSDSAVCTSLPVNASLSIKPITEPTLRINTVALIPSI